MLTNQGGLGHVNDVNSTSMGTRWSSEIVNERAGGVLIECASRGFALLQFPSLRVVGQLRCE